jgi:integrase
MSTLPVPPEQTTLFETGVDVSSVRAVRDRLLKSAHAHNTVRAYAFAWRSFRAWCVDAGRASLPASPDTLTLFAAWCVEQGFRLQTIQLRLAAILRYHVEAGLPTPMDDSVRELLASAAREKREPKAGKAALTLRQLRRMCTLLQNDASTISTRDCALLLLGFAAGWRRSSLASLDLSDVDFRRRGMLVVLRSSKTDQEGRGLLVGIPYGDSELTCPVRALKAWVKVRGSWPGPLFTRVSQIGNVLSKGLTGETVNDRVKRALLRIGVNPDAYGAHSLRAGYATTAAEAGASDIAIMQRAGWKSMQTVLRYVRPARAFRANPMRGVL